MSGRGAIALRHVSEEPGKSGATVGLRHVLDGRSGGKLMLIATTMKGLASSDSDSGGGGERSTTLQQKVGAEPADAFAQEERAQAVCLISDRIESTATEGLGRNPRTQSWRRR